MKFTKVRIKTRDNPNYKELLVPSIRPLSEGILLKIDEDTWRVQSVTWLTWNPSDNPITDDSMYQHIVAELFCVKPEITPEGVALKVVEPVKKIEAPTRVLPKMSEHTQFWGDSGK